MWRVCVRENPGREFIHIYTSFFLAKIYAKSSNMRACSFVPFYHEQ